MNDVAGAFASPPTTKTAQIATIAALLEKHQIDVDAIGSIKQVRIGSHQGYIKNADGVVEYTDPLANSSLVFTPSWETGPEWPVVQQAAPRRPKPPVARPARVDGTLVTVVLPDPQMGWHVDVDGEWHPFHDEAAIDVALAVAKAVRPDRIVWVGDYLDLAAQGKYRKQPGWAQTTQATLDYGHDVLARCVEIAPTDLIEGNHDARMRYYTQDNAAAAFGIKQANAPKSWPVMSVPHLLRLDDLGVTYHSGYPASRVWLADDLAVDHGFNLRDSKTLGEEQVSIIHGHTHHVTTQWQTRRLREGSKETLAASPGCLCRIDGAVPGVRTATDDHARPVKAHQNWQQGLAVVTHDDHELLNYEPVRIREGVAWFRGRRFACASS